jgi:transglutaminase-like putative cysteine protease
VNRTALVVGLLLVLVGLSVFAWKAFVLELPLAARDAEGLWRVELEITARGTGRRGSVRAPLPSTGPGQVVFDERSSSDRLIFTIRTEDGDRVGVWSGRLSGVHQVVHGFRVQLSEVTTPLPSQITREPSRELIARHAGPAREFPSDAPDVRAFLEGLWPTLPPSPLDRLRTLFSFVTDEIATVSSASDDALLTLAAREGSTIGKSRLLVTLLRAVGLPARTVLGLQLVENQPPFTTHWVEAWVDGVWVPMSSTDGFFATRPANLLELRDSSLTELETTGIAAAGHRYHALRERLRPEELAAMMIPASPALARVSLYQLPVSTQSALRVLLLMPLGALVVALIRNLVGVTTFGTFMPVLISLALREVALAAGLMLVAAVLLIGILGRLVLERMHLLLVPRLGVLLCVVVLLVASFALLGRDFEVRELSVGVLFPMVILTMLIERFSVTLAEEGLRPALVRAGWSVAAAVAVYPIFHSPAAEHLMFGFPELVIVVMGLLIWIGAYSGYRISDLIRFRAFAKPEGGSLP